jgi:hypothetical protein
MNLKYKRWLILRKLNILSVIIGIVLIGGILLIGININNRNDKPSADLSHVYYDKPSTESGHVYSDRLSSEDLLILKQPVTMETLAKVVGEISSVEDVGSGRTIYFCESSKYGGLILELERSDRVEGKLEIMACTVSNEEDLYVLFGKYDNPSLNVLPKQ